MHVLTSIIYTNIVLYLYLDMQSNAQDAYISAAWFKEMTKLCQFPNFPLYLFQLVYRITIPTRQNFFEK